MRKFSKRSLNNLEGVHPKLRAVVEAALQRSEVDFTVVEGLRTYERQVQLKKDGFSKTLKSYHLKQSDGHGHAVDLYPYYNGSVQVEPDKEKWLMINKAMMECAEELGVNLTWGGNWKTIVDQPHYQIEF